MTTKALLQFMYSQMTPHDILIYHSMNEMHQKLLETEVSLRLLEEKLPERYVLRTFRDFYDIVTCLTLPEEHRIEHSIRSHKHGYFVHHHSEIKNKRSMIRLSREHQNVLAEEYLME